MGEKERVGARGRAACDRRLRQPQGQLSRWSPDGVLLVPKSDSGPPLMCEGLSAKTDPSQKVGPVMGWRLLPPAASPALPASPCERGAGVAGTTGRGAAAAHPPPDRRLLPKCRPQTGQSRSASTRREFDGGILAASLGGLSREQPTSQMGSAGQRPPAALPRSRSC